MKPNNIDELFKSKIETLNTIPKDIKWNKYLGWESYQQNATKIKNRKITIYFSSIAAALIAILIITNTMLTPSTNTFYVNNETNVPKLVSLSDEIQIWLNKNSSVEYHGKLDELNSTIRIEGEAFIHIKKSFNYTIKAYNAIIKTETLTSFNLRAYPSEENVDITVTSGVLKVLEQSYQEGLAILVPEGNYCSVHKSQKLVYASNNINNNYLAWKTGILVFNNQPIATVKDILAEYYNTTIELEDNQLAYCLFTGSFENQSIETILEKMRTNLNFVIVSEGNKIKISGNGCL